MKCCVGYFHPRTGTGTQTVSGIVDRDGVAFEPELVIFQSAYAAKNTVTSGLYPTSAYADFRGADDGTKRAARAVADVYMSNGKIGSGGESLGDYSLIGLSATQFAGGEIFRRAKISSTAVGSFTLDYNLNNMASDDVLFVAFADLTVDYNYSLANSTYSTTAAAVATLVWSIPAMATSGGTSPGSGGASVGWGWNTSDGTHGSVATNVVSQGANYRTSQNGQLYTQLSDVGAISNGTPVAGSWGSSSYAVTGASGSLGVSLFSFAGDGVVAASGSFSTPTATGLQVIETGIAAKFLMLASVGTATGGAINSTQAELCHGWSNGSTQVGFWSGESVSGNGTPLTGARYLSTDSVLRFGTANGSSTTFDAVASVVSISDSGTVTLNWSSVAATAYEVQWFALGSEVSPDGPAYTVRELTRRRVRRSPIVFAEKDGLQTRVRVDLFAVDVQPGVGTRDVPDPQVMVRASKDGGRTWGNWRQMSAGAVGQYSKRLNAWRWGAGRQWVFEVVCSDPVQWNLVNAYLKAEGGAS